MGGATYRSTAIAGYRWFHTAVYHVIDGRSLARAETSRFGSKNLESLEKLEISNTTLSLKRNKAIPLVLLNTHYLVVKGRERVYSSVSILPNL